MPGYGESGAFDQIAGQIIFRQFAFGHTRYKFTYSLAIQLHYFFSITIYFIIQIRTLELEYLSRKYLRRGTFFAGTSLAKSG